MTTLITNIQELLQIRDASIRKVSGAAMAILPSIKNAYLLIENDLIADFGSMENCPKINAYITIDATGKVVFL
jgi:imidazolonepropionase